MSKFSFIGFIDKTMVTHSIIQYFIIFTSCLTKWIDEWMIIIVSDCCREIILRIYIFFLSLSLSLLFFYFIWIEWHKRNLITINSIVSHVNIILDIPGINDYIYIYMDVSIVVLPSFLFLSRFFSINNLLFELYTPKA